MIRRAALRAVVVVLAFTALPPAGPIRAAAGEPPGRQEAGLLLRALAYDRNLTRRAGPAIRVVVLYRSGAPSSELRCAEMTRAFEEEASTLALTALPLYVESLAWTGPAALEARLAAGPVALLYVEAALRPEVEAISALSRRHAAVTATDTPALVMAGLSVGVLEKGGRVGVMLNLAASRREGADFDAALLGLARLVRRER